jgi:hypothetical protein
MLMTELRVVATVSIRFISETSFVRNQAALTEATIFSFLFEGDISCVYEASHQKYMCGNEGTAPRFLKLGTNRGRVVSFNPLLLYLKRKDRRVSVIQEAW